MIKTPNDFYIEAARIVSDLLERHSEFDKHASYLEMYELILEEALARIRREIRIRLASAMIKHRNEMEGQNDNSNSKM